MSERERERLIETKGKQMLERKRGGAHGDEMPERERETHGDER